MLSYSIFITGNTAFERNILSKDLALLSNTILSSQADINYNYSSNIDLSIYDFKFSGNEISISEKDMNSFISSKFFENKLYNSQLGYSPTKILDYANFIILNKQGNKYSLGLKIDEPSLYICPYTDLQNPETQIIILDSIINLDNDYSSNIIESTKDLFDLDYQENQMEFMHILSATDFTLDERKTKLLETQPNITIILETIESTKNLTNIYYHSNHNHSLNSLKLACLTANNIKSSVNSTIHLIPIDPSSQNNTLSLLHFNNQTTIYIEINYIEFNLTHIPKIAGAIKDAIKYS